jgi:hypothetical protein
MAVSTLPAKTGGRDLARKFKQRIVRQHMVRFHMGLIVAATTASGLLSSKLLLEAGLLSVRLRYPLAVLGACLVFLGLTRLWVGYVLMGRPGKGSSWFNWRGDGVDLPSWGGGSSGGGSSPAMAFGGGDSGGGGASGSWDAGDLPSGGSPAGGGGGGVGSSWFPSLDLNIDLDDGIWILLALAALILVIFGAGAWLVYAAPEILPDAALSALMASCLSRAAKRAESQGWVSSVLRSTWVPMLLVLVLATVLAFVVHHHCPGAARIMEALVCPDAGNS